VKKKAPGHYFMRIVHPDYEMQRIEITVGDGAAITVDIELHLLKTNIKELVGDLVGSLSNNSNTLLILGVLSLSFASFLLGISFYYKRKTLQQKLNNSNGFHRYSELKDEDEESAGSGFLNKPINSDLKAPSKYSTCEFDNQKLLTNGTDDEEDCDRIFVR
jgi:hypothetical protein